MKNYELCLYISLGGNAMISSELNTADKEAVREIGGYIKWRWRKF